MKPLVSRRAHLATRDRAVVGAKAAAWPLLTAAVLAAALSVSCSGPPVRDPTTLVRLDPVEAEGENDGETAETAPAPVAKATGPLVWVASEEEALVQSRAERRPMLVQFAADWCAACNRMAKETFGDPRVKTQAGRFVAVRIDATNDEDPHVDAALKKYAVLGVPTLILLDSSGHEQLRITDFVRADTLLKQIERVR
jgi:thiol-disulfide isomerase/thioredoxin